MSKFTSINPRNGRVRGEFHSMENNLVNRTVAEQIDDHIMTIYRLVKDSWPQVADFVITVEENEKGDDVVTKMHFVRVLHEPKEKEEK